MMMNEKSESERAPCAYGDGGYGDCAYETPAEREREIPAGNSTGGTDQPKETKATE